MHAGRMEDDATALAQGMREGSLVPVQVMRDHIERIRDLNPRLCAVAHSLVDAALKASELVMQSLDGERLLACVPVSLKGNLVLGGAPTLWGTRWSRDNVAAENGELVRRVLAAGAIPVAKSNVPQALMLPETVNDGVPGRTLHPTHHDRTCGGSSGGEAVMVATAMAALGFGTDIGGSIRIPAAFCGIFGFKPTPGRAPLGTDVTRFATQEAIPTAAGPLARSARDIDLAMRAICEPHAPWRAAVPAEALRWGYWTGGEDDDPFFEPCPTQARAVEEAAQALLRRGHRVRKLRRGPDVRQITHLFFALMSAEGGMRAFLAVMKGEMPLKEYAHMLLLARLPNWTRPCLAWWTRHVMGEERVADLMLHTGPKTVSQYFELLRQRRALVARWRAWMDAEQIDVVLAPVAPTPAFRHGESRHLMPSFGTTFWANLLQCPAGVAPWTTVQPDECTYKTRHTDRWARAAARTMDGAAGLPVGVQVLARPFEDETCVAALRVLEQARQGPQGGGPV